MESRPNPPDASRVAISSDQELAVEQAAAEPPPQPGPRARALQKVFDNALSASLKACSYENFAACFPTPARYVPERLEGLWQNMMARIREFAQREFEAILSERAVVPALNGLDRLIAEARARRDSTLSAGGEVPVAPHTLPPSQIYIAHLTPYLLQAQGHLNAKTQTAQVRNAELFREVEKQRAEVGLLLGRLEEVLKDLDEAAAEVSKEKGRLREGIDEVEGLMGKAQ